MRYEQPEMEILLFEGKVDTIDTSNQADEGEGNGTSYGGDDWT